MRTIALVNAKGGTGKTSLAVHLATGLSKAKKKVLLIDLDPQANATEWVLATRPPPGRGIGDALQKGKLEPVHLHPAPRFSSLTIAPSTTTLSATDIALAAEVGGQTILRRIVDTHKTSFDVVVLDCPPNIGLTVVSALYASDGIIVPIFPAFMSLSGVRQLSDTLERIRERLNARTDVLGYVMFGVDNREAIAAETREVLGQQMGSRLFKAEIRISTAAKSLPARHETAWDDGADPRGGEDYKAFLGEVISRLETTRLKAARTKRA